MSIYKRVSGNLLVQTVGATDSITFQGATANTATVIIDGNLTVTGNVALTGNIAGDKIFNGTTSIEIPVASGNANISVSGTSNVFVANSAGIAVTGTASASGNITGDNINTAGLVSATGNVNGGNLNIASGNIELTRSSTSTTSPTIRFTDSNTAVSSLGANIGSFEWYTADATGAGPRVTAAVKAVYADGSGNANVLIQTASGASLTNRIVVLGATGNVGVANSAPLHTLAVSGTMYGSSTLDAVGNITGGNITTAGRASVTGNVVGGNVTTVGLITATGNISGGNISAAGGIVGGAGGVSVTGNVTGGNLLINGIISASGNLTTTDISATTLTATGNVTGGNIKTLGISNVGTSIVTGTQTVTGNITGANVNAGILSASGNINGLNVNTGVVSATGNVTISAGGFFVGDGGFLSNVTVASNVAVTQLANGTSNWAIRSSGGDITGDVGGSANVAILTGSGFSLTGFMSAAGNVTGGNVNTAGLISATGNIIGGNVSGATGTFTTVIGGANASNLTSGTVPSDRLTGQYTIDVLGSAITANTVVIAAQPNITSVGTLTVLSVNGNVTGGNANIIGTTASTSRTTGALKVAGGIGVAGDLYAGNSVTVDGGAYGNVVTTQFASMFATGSGPNPRSIIQTRAADGVAGIGIQAYSGINGQIYANTGITFTTGSTLRDKDFPTGGTTSATLDSTGLAVTGIVSASGNITGGNVNTTALSLSGNVISALNASSTIVAGTTISAVGNITGSYFIGNGSQLSGIDATSIQNGTSNVRVVSSGGNVAVGIGGTSNVSVFATTGQYITGLISATGNITGANINGNGSGLSAITGANVTGTVSSATTATSATSATTAGTVTTGAQGNITSVGTLSSLAVTGNITGGNLSVSTGTVTAGNIVNSNANGVGNIGSSTVYYNTVFAMATSAQYADLAEKFRADADYAPGTVLVFGGDQEVTMSTVATDRRLAGVVSTNPSYLMNAGLDTTYPVTLALQGRVPCRVSGPVRKGDMLVSAPGGAAQAHEDPPTGAIIGKSLENFDGGIGIIEIVVGRD